MLNQITRTFPDEGIAHAGEYKHNTADSVVAGYRAVLEKEPNHATDENPLNSLDERAEKIKARLREQVGKR